MKTNRQAPLPARRIDQVMRLLGQGLMVKEVAQALGVSVPTVMTYVHRIQNQRKLPDLHRVCVWCVEQKVRRETSQT